MASQSFSVMKNCQGICGILRGRYFGQGSSPKDYTDSYTINHAVDLFPVEARWALMDKWITEKDKADIKVSKSLNFRSDCYKKIVDIGKILEISPPEVLRRILYYSLEYHEGMTSEREFRLSSLKIKAALLKNQIEASLLSINEIMDEIARLEAKEA